MLHFDVCGVSCGLVMICGQSTYKTAEVFIKDFLTLRIPQPNLAGCSFTRRPGYMYTQYLYTHCPSKHGPIGTLIKEYIEKHGLGKVTESAPGNNPVHGSETNPHDIVVWIWTLDLKACEKHSHDLSQAEAEAKAIKTKAA